MRWRVNTMAFRRPRGKWLGYVLYNDNSRYHKLYRRSTGIPKLFLINRTFYNIGPC